jgi:hypothetical protein
MTSILSAKQRASRRPALLEMSLEAQRTKSKQRQGKKRSLSRRDRTVWAPASSILVILHYLLKNNITFMWGIGQEKSPPEGASRNRVTGTSLLTEGGGRIVHED